jgi:hypothetical protein
VVIFTPWPLYFQGRSTHLLEAHLLHHLDIIGKSVTVIFPDVLFYFVQILVPVKKMDQKKKELVLLNHCSVLCRGAVTLRFHVQIKFSSLFQFLRTG